MNERKILDYPSMGLTIPDLIKLRDFYKKRLEENDSNITREEYIEAIEEIDNTLYIK